MSTKKRRRRRRRRRLLKRQAHFYNKPLPSLSKQRSIPLSTPGRRGESLCSLRNNSSRVLKVRGASLGGGSGGGEERKGRAPRRYRMTSADARMTKHPPSPLSKHPNYALPKSRIAHSARHNYASPRATARTIVETMSDIIRRTPGNPRCRSIISRDG